MGLFCERLAPICFCPFFLLQAAIEDLVKRYTWLERRYCLGPFFCCCCCVVAAVLSGASTDPPSGPHHHAPFAFLITLQMCLMAEQSLCTERGAPAGIQEACLCELS